MSADLDEHTHDLMIRFLLGELSAVERIAIEERFLAEGDFFDKLLAIESSLVDDYLAGRLPATQMQRVKELFESSPAQRRDKIQTEELIALVRQARLEKAMVAAPVARPAPTGDHVHGATNTEVARPAWDFVRVFAWRSGLPALAVLVALMIFGWLIYRIIDLNSQRRDSEQQRLAVERSDKELRESLDVETQRNIELAKQLEEERNQRARTEDRLAQLQTHQPGEVSTVILSPIIFERGASPKVVTLKPKTAQFQFVLRLDPDQRFDQYNLVLTTFDGARIWGREHVAASQAKRWQIALTLPASLLTYEDYRIELRGLSAPNGASVHVADYAFKIRK